MTKTYTTEQLTSSDTRVVLDEVYYTVTGAMKVLGVGKNAIVNGINDCKRSPKRPKEKH